MDELTTAVFLPVELDAFVINPKVCELPPVRIAPITRPDYAGLSVDGKSTVHDVLPRVDLSLSNKASQNPRICRYGDQPSEPSALNRCAKSLVDPDRTGVHLSWRLPSCYRVAFGQAPPQAPLGQVQPTKSIATYPKIPNRWLVVRRILESDPEIRSTGPDSTIRGVELWVVESDRQWRLADLPPDIDLEMELSPFLSSIGLNDGDQVKHETQTYVGQKTPWNQWQEDQNAPRAPMSNVAGSNPYFLDCAMHNINSLSFFDNLTYVDDQGNLKYFNSINCSYTVLGFHSLPEDDPISGKNSVFGAVIKHDQQSFEKRLRLMGIADTTAVWTSLQPGMRERPDAVISTYSLGKIAGVTFQAGEAPLHIPANDFAAAFTDKIDTEPIGIGMTTLDALIALLRAHEHVLGADADEAVAGLLSLQEIVLAADGDDYDSRIKANDYVQSHVYRDLPGEDSWRLEPQASQSEDDAQLTAELQELKELNSQQRLYAAVLRRLKSRRWMLFAEFFKYVASPSSTGDRFQERERARARVHAHRQNISALLHLLQETSSKISDLAGRSLKNSKGLEKAAGPSFSQRKDPSLCFAGLKVTGVTTEKSRPVGYTYDQLGTVFERPLVDNIYRWEEATAPRNPSDTLQRFLDCVATMIGQPSSDVHEFLSKEWSDTQAWSPLYLEWEVEYFHIPKEKWSVTLRSRAEGTNHSHLHYEVKQSLITDSIDYRNRRRFVGRSPLVPQVGYSLRTLVEQILQRRGLTGGEENLPRNNKARTKFLDSIDALPFASATLSGFTAHLLTRGTGVHVKPNYQDPDEKKVTALRSALAAALPIGLGLSDFELMDDETAQTPYADLVDIPADGPDAFFGVAHGQFVIRRLDIIDKFGQVVTAPVPHLSSETAKSSPHHIHPCVSDLLSPGRTVTNEYNTIFPCTEMTSSAEQPLCPFIQLPPTINQPARINLAFVVPTLDHSNAWRSTTEWENPIWGWVVMNLADTAFQIYTHEGVFVTEFRFGGPKGVQKGAQWLPFKPPKSQQAHVKPKLHDLLLRMAHEDGASFLQVFWDTIASASQTTAYTPADYATGTSAIVGKPLALVDVGISLELSDAPIEAQYSSDTSQAPSEVERLSDYEFEYKIGDTERPYDGVLGFFDCARDSTATDLSALYSPLASATLGAVQVYDMNDPAHFDTLSAYWIDPLEDFSTRSYAQMHDDKFLRQDKKPNVKSLIMDPYAPVHVYTGVLPTVSITLPRRFVQATLSKMTAFYTVGPIVLPTDVPAIFDAAAEPETITWIEQAKKQAESMSEPRVKIPAKAIKGDWLWLQPYAVDSGSMANIGDVELPDWQWRRYDAFEVGPENTILGQMQTPPTLVEGYLQLARPLAKPE